MCAKHGLDCYIVSPEEDYHPTINSKIVEKFGAKIIKTPLESVSNTIDALMKNLIKEVKPYFIPGGGHGNIGTQAYVNAYNEICEYEKTNNIYFDYIFLASGTGTTQAGLVCGAVLNNDYKRKIIGISIARKNPRGINVVKESVDEYLGENNFCGEIPQIIFDDSYICDGYGKYNSDILKCIEEMMKKEGIPLNRTYTGKAFWGMTKYIEESKIENKNILFLHTGGAPLYFDDLGE